MPISLPSFPTRRLVLLRFTRGAPAGDPLPDAPDIDERGYRAPFEGPMASLAAGNTVQVGLRRFLLEARTPLFVESSDPSVVKVVAALRDVYERKPVTLIRAMYERPAPPTPTRAAQAFADAFRVRPPEER